MAISTFSKFYFGTEITLENEKFDFNEGSGELTVTLDLGVYSLTGLAAQLQEELNAVGTLTYTVTFDRGSRIFTISASGSFDILIDTGTNASSGVYSVFGFTGTADLTSASSYEAPEAAGSEYITQFPLQDYVAPGERVESGDASVNTSADGQVEVVSFGEVEFIEMNLFFITNRMLGSYPFRYNPTGKADALTFVNFARKRGPIEFMPDADNSATFFQVTLESTPEDRQGTKFKLKEETGKSLPDIYRTGRLEFRITE